jgi:CHAT domain-containing protein/Tfp pilus assembly protein PilF
MKWFWVVLLPGLLLPSLARGQEPSGAHSDVNKAAASYRIGDYAASLEHYRHALDLRRQEEGADSPGVAFVHNEMGLVCIKQGKYPQALKHFEKALDIWRKANGEESAPVATALNNIGEVYNQQGAYDKALEYSRKALALRRKLPDTPGADLAASLNNVGLIYFHKAAYDKALAHYSEALDVLKKLGPEHELAVVTTLSNIGAVYNEEGEYARALDYFQKGLDIRLRLLGPDNPEVALGRLHLGLVRENLGEYAAALEQYEKALAVLRKAYGEQHPLVATALNNIGVLYRREGKYDRALDDYRQALSIRRKVYGEQHPDVALSLLNIGYVHSLQHDYARAERSIDEALLALRQPHPDGTWPAAPFTPDDLRPLPLTVNVLAARGMVQEKAYGDRPTIAQLRDCDNTYALALGLLEHVRDRVLEADQDKLRLGVKWSDLYPQRIGLLSRMYEADHDPAHLAAAFTTAEEGTARVFLEQLGRARANVVGGVGQEQLAQQEALLDGLRETDGRIVKELNRPLGTRDPDLARRLLEQRRRQEQQVEQFVAQLEKEHPQYAALQYPTPCTLAEARACLAPNETALLFIPGTHQSYVVVVDARPTPGDSSGGVAVVPLADADTLTDLVGSLTNTETLALPARVRDLAADAFEQLLGPVKGRLNGKDLVSVPGGALCFLPFEILVDYSGHYLVEQHRIRYAPSLTVLHLIQQWEQTRPRPDCPLWAVGDPVCTPTDIRLRGAGKLSPTSQASLAEYRSRGGRDGRLGFDRLLFSGVEVRDVSRVLGASPDEVRTGLKASEAAVKQASRDGELARARYLHFATHGILGLDTGEQPSLVLSLAGNDREDGFLQLDEVTSLKLNADLVVLSACRSGQGRLRKGEGVTGLARAFLYAGSRGVLCSLWSVNDQQTARLMTLLYKGLKAGNAPADSLRGAQQAMIQEGKAPLYWAPFVLMGGSGKKARVLARR